MVLKCTVCGVRLHRIMGVGCNKNTDKESTYFNIFYLILKLQIQLKSNRNISADFLERSKVTKPGRLLPCGEFCYIHTPKQHF